MASQSACRWNIDRDCLMNIAVIGGGINGLCCAWRMARGGHRVSLYERSGIMRATSSASSKLLHGGLRYLENREFGLVKEALRERSAWLERVPGLAHPVSLVIPVYRQGRRRRFTIGIGLFIYDFLASESALPKSRRLPRQAVVERSPGLETEGLVGGYEFFDGQMDDYQLGLWVADQAGKSGVSIFENAEVVRVDPQGTIILDDGDARQFDRVCNVTGPWAARLLRASGIASPLELDLVRGSHLILSVPCPQAMLLEVPGERRILFVLPWKGKTLLGTTEVRQSLDDPIECSAEERSYLLAVFRHYWPDAEFDVEQQFSGLRPLIRGHQDPNRTTREYAVTRQGNLISVFGGKWTTAMSLAEKVTDAL
jgi:glycerol-3-phosphate dehydrogenase